LDRLEESVEKLVGMKEVPKRLGRRPFEVVSFSDSILLYTVDTEPISAVWFGLVCGALVTTMFWTGLPVRGAISAGEFLVRRNSQGFFFAGFPIVEAYEFAGCLQLAGCVVAPSVESEVRAWNQTIWLEYDVPLKGVQRQSMTMLDNYVFWKGRELSRAILIEKFRDHGKRIDPGVLVKVNNTLCFLNVCKLRVVRKEVSVANARE